MQNPSLANTVGFELLGSDLGNDVEIALKAALEGGAVFPDGSDPLVIFQKNLASSITDIETHPRGKLFQEFLLKGPYEDSGEIPAELVNQRLSDTETASTITFIYSHMVNCFKGAVTELLAANTCLQLMKQLQQHGELSPNARLYIGDSVGVHRPSGKGILKGGDQHILIEERGPDGNTNINVVGVTEVKSYVPSQRRLQKQINHHLQRATNGLIVDGVNYPKTKVNVGYGPNRRALRIVVVPSSWKLPRKYQFEGQILQVEPAVPLEGDTITLIGDDEWRITLKWSVEALAQAAFEMTFWYMAKVGEVIYSESVPRKWKKMTPSEAGQNAVKMMLYYALMRCHTNREKQRAIALYNSYCFGYALGMNFKNSKGRREMLWFEDLEEILASGKTKRGDMLR
ncbi:MAG: hypothetical protein JAZ11_02775 [Candidatus Thiodiazotropha lotti]|nr:hypothetical protein [Candidatus Thiodiazotropha lotti]